MPVAVGLRQLVSKESHLYSEEATTSKLLNTSSHSASSCTSAYSQGRNSYSQHCTKKIIMLLKTALQNWLLHQPATSTNNTVSRSSRCSDDDDGPICGIKWGVLLEPKKSETCGAAAMQCNCTNSNNSSNNKPCSFELIRGKLLLRRHIFLSFFIHFIFWEPGARCSIQWKCKVD